MVVWLGCAVTETTLGSASVWSCEEKEPYVGETQQGKTTQNRLQTSSTSALYQAIPPPGSKTPLLHPSQHRRKPSTVQKPTNGSTTYYTDSATEDTQTTGDKTCKRRSAVRGLCDCSGITTCRTSVQGL